MKLIDDWRAEINRLWSVRVAIFAALLGVADQVLSTFGAQLPPVVYSVIAVAIALARVARQT